MTKSTKHAVDTRVQVNQPGTARHGQKGTVVGHEGDDHVVKFDGTPEDIERFKQEVLLALMSGDDKRLDELQKGAEDAKERADA